jgi:hypothetical protein
VKLYSLSKSLDFKLNMVKLSEVNINCSEEDYFTSLTDILDNTFMVNFYSTENSNDFCKKSKTTFIQQEFLKLKEQKNKFTFTFKPKDI